MGSVLRRALLRWQGVLALSLIALPVLATSILGIVWLVEHQLSLPFVIGAVGIGVVITAFRFLMRLWVAQGGVADSVPELPHVEAEADWTVGEHAAFDAACDLIRSDTGGAPWVDIPVQIQRVLETVAGSLSGGKRGEMDFTVPEALLLAEQVASRSRYILRRYVPVSDRVPVSWALWAIRHQDRALLAGKFGWRAWRAWRFWANPAQAVIQEVVGHTQGIAVDVLSEKLQRETRCLLLEEVAHAAVQLYSGRLRFSDAELLQIELESTGRDRQGAATPDEPVRVLVVGQVSSGKSSLVNALLGEDKAETDVARITDRITTYDAMVADIPYRIIDIEGLDGSDEVLERVANEMMDADMVLWAVRADRPARGPDVALREDIDSRLVATPERRLAPVVTVMTFADRIVSVQNLPEGTLNALQRIRMQEAATSIAADLSCLLPVPVRCESPDWNIQAVADSIINSLGEALMVQRNRRRLQANAERSILDDAGTTIRGGANLVSTLGSFWWQHRFGSGQNRKRGIMGLSRSSTQSSPPDL